MVVHRIIYEELCLGVIREESRQAHRAIIGRLVAAGAEGVVLGCTELELLVRANDVAGPVFPTAPLLRRSVSIVPPVTATSLRTTTTVTPTTGSRSRSDFEPAFRTETTGPPRQG